MKIKTRHIVIAVVLLALLAGVMRALSNRRAQQQLAATTSTAHPGAIMTAPLSLAGPSLADVEAAAAPQREHGEHHDGERERHGVHRRHRRDRRHVRA